MPSRARIDFTVRMQRIAASPRFTMPMQCTGRTLGDGIEVLTLQLGEPGQDLARDVARATQAALVALRFDPRDPRAQRVAARGQPAVLALGIAAQVHAQDTAPRDALYDPAHAIGGVLDLDPARAAAPTLGKDQAHFAALQQMDESLDRVGHLGARAAALDRHALERVDECA